MARDCPRLGFLLKLGQVNREVGEGGIFVCTNVGIWAGVGNVVTSELRPTHVAIHIYS